MVSRTLEGQAADEESQSPLGSLESMTLPKAS